MNCNALEKSKPLLSRGKTTEKEDLYMLTDEAQDQLYGRARVLLWGPWGPVPTPGETAVCLENADREPEQAEGSSSNTHPVRLSG